MPMRPEPIKATPRLYGARKILFWLCGLALLFLTTQGFGQDYRPNEMIISLRAQEDIYALALQYRFVPLERLPGTQIWRVRVLDALWDTLTQVQVAPAVEFAELNYILDTPEAEQESMAFLDAGAPAFVDTQSPGRYFDQPAYRKLRIGPAHEFTTGQGVVVAVVDTGISRTHPALDKRTRGGWDFVDRDADPTDEPGGAGYGHGTFVAGIIALVAPGAEILPLRALDPSGQGDIFTVAQAIRYGVDQGAQVINLSLGLPRRSFTVEGQILYAEQKDVVVVASAGNHNSGEPQYPAACRMVIGVAAVDQDDIKARFSNFQESLSVSAPGVQVYSAFPEGRFAFWSGTSFAAAFVTGEAALLRAFYPQKSAQTVNEILKQFSEDIYPWNPDYVGKLGVGRINCLSALRPR